MRLWIWRTLAAAFTVVAAFVIVGLFLSQQYVISRSIEIAAPPAKVWLYIGDLKNWPAWSPWKDGDPTIETTIGPQTTGVGASQTWIGDSGDGKLVFTNSVPDQEIAFDLEFRQGAEQAQAAITLLPTKEGTEVTWTMTGEVPVPVIGGYFAQYLLPGMIAPMFELGLQKLKDAAEKGTPLAAPEPKAEAPVDTPAETPAEAPTEKPAETPTS